LIFIPIDCTTFYGHRDSKNGRSEHKTDKQERPNKDEIKGLPAHAQYQFRQGTWYVYFPYCFREDGKRKQERDYIGTLSPDGKEFLPNLWKLFKTPISERWGKQICLNE